LTESFYGREDPGLTDSLLGEAAGIFNWALDGLDRLNRRGYFEMPRTSQDAVRHLEDLASPVGAFVREECTVGVGFQVDKDQLWDAWRIWAESEGHRSAGKKEVFVRDLRAAVPGLKPRRPRDGAKRRHVIEGIALGRQEQLAQQSHAPLTTPDQAAQNDGGQEWSGVEPIVTPTLGEHL
jgi:putative DNA primase/helicase